jgi:tetratricopeptide (TPR) repeat protein
VVSPDCLKDLNCVSACPDGSVAFGFTRPSFLASLRKGALRRVRWDFSRGEEALAAGVFLTVLAVYRGLYGSVPFLMSLGLGAIAACLAIQALHLLTRRDVRLSNIQLKLTGRLTRAGAVFAVLAGCSVLFTGHSAFIRASEVLGGRALARASAAGDPESIEAAAMHLERCERWGLHRSALHQRRLGAARMALGGLRARQGAWEQAESCFRGASRLLPGAAAPRYNLGVALGRLGRADEAIVEYRAALDLDPRDAEIHNNLGLLLMGRSEPGPARHHLERALEIDPGYAHAHFNLGRLLLGQGQLAEAEDHMRQAARLDPLYARLLGLASGP